MRFKSLYGNEHSKELSEIGAYRDELQKPGLITCYKCGIIFNLTEIEGISVKEKITWLKAGWFFHVRQHPWCTFLKLAKGK